MCRVSASGCRFWHDRAMELGLKNRVAAVAGASQGIGKATAMAFAAEGAHVAICARNGDALEQLAREIEERHGVKAYAEPVDVAEPEAIQRFVRNAQSKLGSVDICVPNAGGPPAKPFLETTMADWEHAWYLNLRSAICFAQAVLPAMVDRRWGRIVTLTSYTVKQPVPELVLSNTIRAGIMGLVRSLAGQFGKDGITVNNVGPGFTETDRSRRLLQLRAQARGISFEQARADLEKEIPVGRMASPQEVAAAIVWLSSEPAASITGQTVLVDGGSYKGL